MAFKHYDVVRAASPSDLAETTNSKTRRKDGSHMVVPLISYSWMMVRHFIQPSCRRR